MRSAHSNAASVRRSFSSVGPRVSRSRAQRRRRQRDGVEPDGALAVLGKRGAGSDLHAGGRRRDQDDRDAAAVARRHQEGIRGHTLEHEALLAVEAEGVAATIEHGLERRRLAHGIALGDRERDHPRSAPERREPLAALLLGAERVQGQSTRDRGEDPERRDGPAAFLEQEAEVEHRRALPARRLGQREPEPSEVGDGLPEGVVMTLRRGVPPEPPLARDLRGEESPRLILDRLLLCGGREVHVDHMSIICAACRGRAAR